MISLKQDEGGMRTTAGEIVSDRASIRESIGGCQCVFPASNRHQTRITSAA